ncbi:hypothetical protein HS5_06260 [Acidianus sp. HS-5]|nr:hypothetical protein HS5_06260 [Acidianus sp. HS-5]
MENIKSELIEKMRNIVELIILTTPIAYLSVYLISTLKLSPYLYFSTFILYVFIAYEIRKSMKLHKSYLRLVKLTEREELEKVRRKFKFVNLSVLAFNIILALTIIYKLPYLIPVMISLLLYFYHRVDDRIIDKEKVLLTTVISVLFSIIIFYEPGYFYILASIAYLVDLVVMKI